jgi:predicted DNA-binding transcriptional regulator AlpA
LLRKFRSTFSVAASSPNFQAQRIEARYEEAQMADNDYLLDAKAACQLIGGSRPINPATLWRGVKSGIFPKPIKITPNANRWKRSELLDAIERRAAERDPVAA